jgi:methionine biosynthesis protein MetW
LRLDLARIAGWIAPGSRVLDRGCGDGALLAHLHDEKQVIGAGVELDDELVITSVRRGVPVIQQNLEEGLALFDDQQFDTVVLSQTLQSMHHTEHILREMARVARFGIVSFPNFGYWPHGWSILGGRMPVGRNAIPVVRHAQHPLVLAQGLRAPGGIAGPAHHRSGHVQHPQGNFLSARVA